MPFDFSQDFDIRLDAIEAAENPDDIAFLVAAVRHFRAQVVAERQRCAKIAEDYGLAAYGNDEDPSPVTALHVAREIAARICSTS